MKSTIPIILGTAALGLMKNKTGSNIKLKLKKVFEVHTDVTVSIPILELSNDQIEENYDYIADLISELKDQDTEITFFEIGLRHNRKSGEYETKSIYIDLSIIQKVNVKTNIGEYEKLIINKVNKFINRIINKVTEIIPTIERNDQYPVIISPPRDEDPTSNIRNMSFEVFYNLFIPMNIYQITLDNIALMILPKKVVINSDTGEEYKPNTKESMLRKR